MAAFDWIATIIGAYFLATYMSWSFILVLVILLLISIPIHMYFGTKTYTNYYLGLDEKPDHG
jgi:hypothetical protein